MEEQLKEPKPDGIRGFFQSKGRLKLTRGAQAGCRRGLAAKLGVREASPDIHPNSARGALLPSDSNKEIFVQESVRRKRALTQKQTNPN